LQAGNTPTRYATPVVPLFVESCGIDGIDFVDQVATGGVGEVSVDFGVVEYAPLQAKLVADGTAGLGHFGLLETGNETDVEVLAQLADGEDKTLGVSHLETGVEQELFLPLPDVKDYAACRDLPKGDSRSAADAEAGLLAVFGVDDDALAVEAIAKGEAIGTYAETAGPVVGAAQGSGSVLA